MNKKKIVYKTRNKKRKNRMYTKKKYNMKKIYGGQDTIQGTVGFVKPQSKFQERMNKIKEGANKISSNVKKGMTSLKTGIEYSGKEAKKGTLYP
jgi:hypothetical protein